MSEGNEWSERAIAEFFGSSFPGEWGTDGTRETGTPVLRSTNFCNDGSIDYSDIAYRSVPEKRLDSRRIGIGTILVEKAGGSSTRPAGRVVYCDREFGGTASNFVEVIQVKADLSAKYVFYLLYHNFHSGLVYKYQQQTTGIINFKLREYSAEIVSVPDSYAEQSKIAEVLSTVDRAIAQTEALIAKQQRIKTGLMQDLLTRGIDEHGQLRSETTHRFKDSPLGRIPAEWEVVLVKSLLHTIEGGWSPGCIDEPPGQGEWGVLKVSAVSSGIYQPSESKRLPSSLSPISALEVQQGDVLLSRANGVTELVGRCAYVRNTPNRLLLSDKTLRLQPILNRVEPYILSLLLGVHSSRVQIVASLSGSSGQKNISQAQIHAIQVRLPPLIEQQHLMSVLEKTSNRMRNEKDSLRKLRSIKTALMQDLLTGKVRVTRLLEPAEAATA